MKWASFHTLVFFTATLLLTFSSVEASSFFRQTESTKSLSKITLLSPSADTTLLEGFLRFSWKIEKDSTISGDTIQKYEVVFRGNRNGSFPKGKEGFTPMSSTTSPTIPGSRMTFPTSWRLSNWKRAPVYSRISSDAAPGMCPVTWR